MTYPDPASLSDHKLEALINFSKFSKSMADFHQALLDEQDRRYVEGRSSYDEAAQRADDECTERGTDAE